ncbi:MAG: zinc ABC transporter substrate-binding protein [Verrucomicrobia bacterium]|nr:zinc ABC transporter substrate-binding protein [Verrucomicrobiota bacterium]
MKKPTLFRIGAATAALSLSGLLAGAAPIKVVTSTPDLKDMVENICGDDVRVESLMTGTENHHAVPLKPTFLVALARCDVLVVNGLEYEHAFLPGALMSVNQQAIQRGASHYIDASQYIKPCEIPSKIDLSLGDLHPLGASHIHIEPGNGILMCKAIYEKMSALYADHAAVWKPRYEAYVRTLYATLQELRAYCQGTEGLKVVFYHPGWCYLTDRLGWDLVGYVEVRAGIEPTPTHLRQLIETIKGRGAKLLAIEACYSTRIPQYVARETGAKVIKIPHHVNALPGCSTYVDFCKTLTQSIADAGREVYGFPPPPAAPSAEAASQAAPSE